MRAHLLIPPALLALGLGCSSELKKGEAETLIRAQYPVTVLIKLPLKTGAQKGSVEAAQLASLKAAAEKSGWFTVQWAESKERVDISLAPTPNAPKEVTAAGGGFMAPVAKASFDRTLYGQTRGSEARATYRVRLEQPTALFPLFELKHPGVHIGSGKERHAIFRKDGGHWVIASTDEKFHKAED